jgi:CheY-specific phosphatase CheX
MRLDATILKRILAETLEVMAFMPPMTDQGQTKMEAHRIFLADIGFDGPENGHLKVRAPENVAGELVLNMLGELDAEEFSDKQKMDALAELTNVVCGVLMAELSDQESTFDLRPPVVTIETAPAGGASSAGESGDSTGGSGGAESPSYSRALVILEDGWVEASLAIDRVSPTVETDG